MGDSLYQAQQYDSARVIFLSGLARARTAGDTLLQARFLTELGLAWYRLGNLPESRRVLEEDIGLKARLSIRDVTLSRSLNALGLVARDEGRHTEAVALFERALLTARSADDPAAIARAAGNLGLPLASLGEHTRARAAYRELRSAGQRLGNPRYEGNGVLNEAMLDVWEGDAPTAIARLDTALVIYRASGNRTGEQFALGQLASAWELAGEYNRALALLDSALSLARELELAGEVADNLRLIAGLHSEAGDWRRALRYYEQADSLLRAARYEGMRGAILRGAASAYLALGNPRRARLDAEEALRLHVRSGEALEQLDDLLLLTELDSTRPADAERHLMEARRIVARLDTRITRLTMTVADARAAERRGDATRALGLVNAAAPTLGPGDLWAEWQLFAVAARAANKLRRPDSAVVLGRRAVQAIERQRGNMGSEILRRTLITDRADVYGELVVTLLRLGRNDDAFAVADGARSRGLLEHFSAVRTTGPEPDLRRGDELLRRIDLLMRRLREVEPTTPRERGVTRDSAALLLDQQLAAARTEYEALATRTARDGSRASSLLGARPPRLAEVQAALTLDEVLLEYFLTSERLIVFVVGRDQFRVVERRLDVAVLRHRIELLRDLWSNAQGNWRSGLPVAQALEAILVAPVREHGLIAGHRRILLVPHGILGQVPFAALHDAETGRFLVEDFALSHLPSAASLSALRNSVTGRSLKDEAGVGLAPFPHKLPASAGEVRAFGAARSGAGTLFGREATEQAIRAALGGSGPVHVATHGTLNVRNPMFSRIELSPPGRLTGADNDGRLEVHELMGLTIRSPLVFLSGCETGAGQAWADDPIRGTADLTLAQAVLSAGADNVISTLWRIRDGGAAAFAARFYTWLQRGGASLALAQAQREMIADPAYSNPFYWAGYILSGEGRFGESPKSGITASVPLSKALLSVPANPRRTP
ncbi:MAG TPA: CHAT domain-containing tetratricopeptide repeat protein [Gemmatimonadales bacterium]|nr:CHAT domain-containing tetratricopeptide repeat protein [Gemmatimonadales bacterium]